MSVIKIKPIGRHHNLFLITAGTISLLLTLAVSSHFWQEFRLVLMFIGLASAVTIFIGVVKRIEPQHSLLISKDTLTYHHKYGNWHIQWQDIQRIGETSVDIGLNKRQLPFVGIKLKSDITIVHAISQRLASRLPHEQRPLITSAISGGLLSWQNAQVNFEPFKLNNKTILKGPKAFFMHHTHSLTVAYGYHLFIPASALDRSIEEFIVLLRQCKSHADAIN